MTLQSLTGLDARRRRALAASAVAALAATGLYALVAPAANAAVPTCDAPGLATVTPDTTTTPGTTVIVVLPASGETSVDIPANVTSYKVDACGGGGGDSASSMVGGRGARVTAKIQVTAPVSLTVRAGSAGAAGTLPGTAAGGNPSGGTGSDGGGGGGGLSGVFAGPVSQASARVVAGGGGGGGATGPGTEGVSTTPTATPMPGGSATATGAGGGGGGYNGGAAGASAGAGGGGGSNYPGGLATSTSSVKPGAIVISYATPRAPSFTSTPIMYDAPEGTADTWTVTVDAAPVAILSDTATPPTGSDTSTVGITFTDNGNNTGTFAISPTTAVGTYTFSVHAQNTVGSAQPDQTETFTIRSRTASTSSPSPSDTSTASMTPSPAVSLTPSASATPSASVTPSASATPSASVTPSASASASASPKTCTSGSASPSGVASPSRSASASATPAGSGTGATSATPSASTSTSRSPSPSTTACPSPSASASRSDTPTTTIAVPQLKVITPDIQPGHPGRLRLTAPPSTSVQLFCYSRPGTTYRQVRPSPLGQGNTVGNSGSIDFSVFPGSNTRCKGQYTNAPASGSNSVVIYVHTTLSLSAYREGVWRYHYQGRSLPRIAGRLITLYRLDRGGREIRTATTRTDASGIWRIDRRFTGSGAFRFVARTSSTLNNAAGKSNDRLTIIH